MATMFQNYKDSQVAPARAKHMAPIAAHARKAREQGRSVLSLHVRPALRMLEFGADDRVADAVEAAEASGWRLEHMSVASVHDTTVVTLLFRVV